MCRLSRNSGSSNLLEPWWPVQVCTGTYFNFLPLELCCPSRWPLPRPATPLCVNPRLDYTAWDDHWHCVTNIAHTRYVSRYKQACPLQRDTFTRPASFHSGQNVSGRLTSDLQPFKYRPLWHNIPSLRVQSACFYVRKQRWHFVTLTNVTIEPHARWSSVLLLL